MVGLDTVQYSNISLSLQCKDLIVNWIGRQPNPLVRMMTERRQESFLPSCKDSEPAQVRKVSGQLCAIFLNGFIIAKR